MAERGSEVLATIPVDGEPKWIAIAPDGSCVCVTLTDFEEDGLQGAVAMLDPQANAVSATIRLGRNPSAVAVAPDGQRAYVPNWDSANGRGVVSVIDTNAGAVVDTIVVSGQGGGTKGVAITPDGRHLYVANDNDLIEGQGRVSVIDTATAAVIATIVVNPFPACVAIRPDGRFAYALDTDGEPAVIDTATHERSFPFGGQAGERIAFTPDGRRAYVVRDSDHQIFVIDVATNGLVTLLDARGLTTDLAITPDGRLLYVTQRTLEPVSVFEIGASTRPTHPVTWSGTADAIAMMPDGLTAYVSDRRSRAVQVIAVSSSTAGGSP